MTEAANEMRRMMVALSAEGARVFRNNVALAIVGSEKVWIKSEADAARVRLRPGDVVVRNGRVLHAGLAEGSHDLIGLTPVTVTPDMVGRSVAVFTSVEAKWGGGRLAPEQKNWGKFVLGHGGIVGEARTADEAVELVRAYRRGAGE